MIPPVKGYIPRHNTHLNINYPLDLFIWDLLRFDWNLFKLQYPFTQLRKGNLLLIQLEPRKKENVTLVTRIWITPIWKLPVFRREVKYKWTFTHPTFLSIWLVGRMIRLPAMENQSKVVANTLWTRARLPLFFQGAEKSVHLGQIRSKRAPTAQLLKVLNLSVIKIVMESHQNH